jgi:ubiquinone/menaquinone biosynthesis C-methylase UbiE
MKDISGYIHSFAATEQDRLMRQARFLAPWVQPGIDLADRASVLEVGCGVGAQMQVLLERFPALRITGVDHSGEQLARARAVLQEPLRAGRAGLVRGSGYALPFADATFDGAYVIWVLEHLGEPLQALREIRRVLGPGTALYCTEVFNAGLYTEPACPAMSEYWQAFNALQRRLGGDPDVGIRLGTLLDAAGFVDVRLADISPRVDARLADSAARREAFAFWRDLLFSAVPQLLAAGAVTPALVDAVAAEFDQLTRIPDGVFVYAAKQARGVRPGPIGNTIGN